MFKVIVIALPGAGKTTILQRVSEQIKDLKLINFGDIMFEEARRSLGIASRDDMRRLMDSESYIRVQERAAEIIGGMSGKIVIDTHAAIKTVNGYYPGLPPTVTRLVRPKSIIFLEFRPEDIINRRMKDSAAGVRRREHESIEEIEEHQRISLMFAVASATYSSCYFVKFSLRYPETYPYQHVDDAASKLIQYLKSLAVGSVPSPKAVGQP
jgi:adenylate kinase